MNLSHFSWKHITEAYSVDQIGTDFKPRGLWVSVDGEDDWPSFCERENFRNLNTQAHYRVHLSEDANIRYVTTEHELIEFHDEFSDTLISSLPRPDWSRVAEQYQGVIFSPYQWSMRLNGPTWYYGYDCASGCLWSKEAVQSIELVRYGSPNKKRLADFLNDMPNQPLARQEWAL